MSNRVYSKKGILFGEATLVDKKPAIRIKQSGKPYYDVMTLESIEQQVSEILKIK